MIGKVAGSVAAPDPEPNPARRIRMFLDLLDLDPLVQGSFYIIGNQAKIVRKTLIPTVFSL